MQPALRLELLFPSFMCGASVVMVMVIYSALVRSHQSTYEGSFGPVPPRCCPLSACLLMCPGPGGCAARELSVA